MTIEELIKHAKGIANSNAKDDYSLLAEALEFLRVYAGEKSSFYKQLHDKTKDAKFLDFSYYGISISGQVKSCLEAFIRFAEKGLLNGISIKRQAEIDIVNDFLSQANILINTKGIHAASACVLGGAVLEEFLWTWIEEQNLSLGKNKPSIDSYTKILYENNLIDKQDLKDITAWAGLRNHAAHGEWEFVADKNKIELMLSGINLFMRKYGWCITNRNN